MTERRRFLRFTTDVGVEYRICQNREINGASYIKDLSREGMRVSFSRSVERGTLLDMKFMLPGDTAPIYLTGEVMWTNRCDGIVESEYMAGVKFFKIDNFDRVRLLDHAYGEWLKSSKSQ